MMFTLTVHWLVTTVHTSSSLGGNAHTVIQHRPRRQKENTARAVRRAERRGSVVLTEAHDAVKNFAPSRSTQACSPGGGINNLPLWHNGTLRPFFTLCFRQ